MNLFVDIYRGKQISKRSIFGSHVIMNKSQIEIRLSNIDQAKEFLKKNPTCKSQILSDKQDALI